MEEFKEIESPETLCKMGQLCREENEFEKAGEYFRKALLFDDKNEVALYGLADVLRCLGDYESSRRISEKVISLNQNNGWAHHNLGVLAYLKGSLAQAEDEFRCALKIMPGNISVSCALAETLIGRRSIGNALEIYAELAELHPGDIGIVLDFAQACCRVGDFKKAEGLLQGVGRPPESDKYNRRISQILVELGRYHKAKEDYQAALAYLERAAILNAGSYEAYYEIGQIHIKNNRLAEAEKCFKESLRIRPDDVNTLLNLGDTYKEGNRDDEAIGLYYECINKNPEFWSAYLALGRILVKKHKFNEAVDIIRKALVSQPQQEDLRAELEWVMRQKRMFELAVTGGAVSAVKITKDEARQILKPRFCAIGIVNRCNFRCKMCRIWENNNRRELSAGQWLDFLKAFKRIADERCQINFAGGEPFLKPELTDLIKCVTESGFISAVCSNSYLIDKETALKIAASGLKTIALSLDSLDRQRHDYLRGVDGSYDRVMQAIELLRRYSPRTEVNLLAIIMQENLDDLLPLAEWAQSNHNIKMINFLGLIQPRGNEKKEQWYKNPESKILWPQDASRLNAVIDRLIEIKSNGVPKIGNPVSQLLNYKRYYADPEEYIRRQLKCNIGYLFLSINEAGYVTLCEEMDPIGNILDKDIYDIWFSEKAGQVREKIKNCNKNCHQVINCCYEEEV